MLSISDARADVGLQAVLEAASRFVDGYTGRFFGQTDVEIRYFRAYQEGFVTIDDLVSLVDLKTDDGTYTFETVWTVDDYRLFPIGSDLIQKPYTSIRVISGSFEFPNLDQGIQIEGIWGWPEVPAQVKQATVLEANRLWRRGGAPFGILGSPELGQMRAITNIDPDIRALLSPFRMLAH